MGQHFQNRTGEERKAFAVVVVTVGGATLEIIFVIHEIISYAAIDTTEQTGILLTPSQKDDLAPHELHGLTEIGADALV